MNEKKARRYPADRVKLHALLDKKRQELKLLQEEVEDLEARCLEADRTEIHATVEMYNISVDELKAWLQEKCADHAIPELPAGVTVAQPADYSLNPDEEEEPLDNEV